jgi:hypothetical protein
MQVAEQLTLKSRYDSTARLEKASVSVRKGLYVTLVGALAPSCRFLMAWLRCVGLLRTAA